MFTEHLTADRLVFPLSARVSPAHAAMFTPRSTSGVCFDLAAAAHVAAA